MIEYSNITQYNNIDFADYLKLDGFSHSFLKHAKNGIASDIEVTEKMRIGSMVDAILTEPLKANMADPIYPYCKDIAFNIKEKFGSLITHFQKQISYTCTVSYDAGTAKFFIYSKGRLDFLLPGHAVIDLKITDSKDVPALIEFMGYINQGWHYCKMAGVKKFYLMVYCIPKKKTFLYEYDCSSDENTFWGNKVLEYGSVEN
jgi:hypothetical protein